jgi:saccharopine dehydrogenase-like NADP-dependent oxidoreductase
MRIVVLGCGFHGRGIAYEIAAERDVSDFWVADRDASRARSVAEKIGARWTALDVRDANALGSLLRGATLVFNAVGPYHLYALGVIEAAIDAGVHYADMNDDHEAAEALFMKPDWDARAKTAGVAMLTGLGMAPGLTGLLARLGHERFDAPDRISIRFVWNYSLNYPAALHHFLRINSGLAPQYIDGAYTRPGAFTGRETVRFLGPVGPKEVYHTGIIDPVTIPHGLPGVEEVTAKGAFLQPEANAWLEAMVRWGMTSYERVEGAELSPLEFLSTYLTSSEGRAYLDIAPLDLPMTVQVEVSGVRRGERKRLTYEAHDHSRRASTSTAARAALMLARGDLSFTGIRAPEGCIEPAPFLRHLMAQTDVEIFEWEDDAEPQSLSV